MKSKSVKTHSRQIPEEGLDLMFDERFTADIVDDGFTFVRCVDSFIVEIDIYSPNAKGCSSRMTIISRISTSGYSVAACKISNRDGGFCDS